MSDCSIVTRLTDLSESVYASSSFLLKQPWGSEISGWTDSKPHSNRHVLSLESGEIAGKGRKLVSREVISRYTNRKLLPIRTKSMVSVLSVTIPPLKCEFKPKLRQMSHSILYIPLKKPKRMKNSSEMNGNFLVTDSSKAINPKVYSHFLPSMVLKRQLRVRQSSRERRAGNGR